MGTFIQRLQGNANMQTITTQVPAVITRTAKFGRRLFETSYNPTTQEVVVKVNGLKLMEQPEELQHKATTLYYYCEAVCDLYEFVGIKFAGLVDMAPVMREVKAMQVRMNARGAQLAAKH